MKRTPMPVEPSKRCSSEFSRIQRTSVFTLIVVGEPGQRERQLDVVADAAQLVRGDEETAGADVLGEAGIEVVVTLEVDFDLEVESLRDSSRPSVRPLSLWPQRLCS